jgi:hypothetical protein
MTRKSTKNVSQGKGLCIAKFPPGGLTCSEWQVDDVLSAGESTQEERSIAKELIHQRPDIPVRPTHRKEGSQ